MVTGFFAEVSVQNVDYDSMNLNVFMVSAETLKAERSSVQFVIISSCCIQRLLQAPQTSKAVSPFSSVASRRAAGSFVNAPTGGTV